jgi:hypothetical protein
MFPHELLDCRLQLLTSTMPTHAEKSRGRRVLFIPLKRANIAAFGLYDRAAGRDGSSNGSASSAGRDKGIWAEVGRRGF